ncbi:single-stranded DNA-binding protein [Candidatus Termititenax aidoneus]|uniref:Single-stranded DNA-binding protein n=1 Tax=Termititenax aidoneus TaxID=2218524 RepID=A0A388TAT7_TERA1|nr:single-stranded DNA-binding protein [Candidatus Termititenax aidoneus]
MNFNSIVLIGTVQEKPETKYTTESGLSVSKFTLNVARPPRPDGQTSFDKIPVVAFGRQADYSAENLQANSLVLVEGRIQVNRREASGQKFSQTEINAKTVRLFNAPLAAPVKTVAAASNEPPAAAGNPFNGATEDDVPF